MALPPPTAKAMASAAAIFPIFDMTPSVSEVSESYGKTQRRRLVSTSNLGNPDDPLRARTARRPAGRPDRHPPRYPPPPRDCLRAATDRTAPRRQPHPLTS